METNRPEETEELKFEKALEELESIVSAMEAGELPLEDMMKQFERGVKLSKFCVAKLGETEKMIEVLMEDDSGAPVWQEATPAAEQDNSF